MRNLHVLTHSFPTRRSSDLLRGFLIWLDTVILNPSIGEYASRYLYRYRFLVLPLMLCLYSAGSHAARCSISGHYGSLLMACSYSPMMTADMKNDTYTGTGLPLKLDMIMPNPIATDTAPICPRRTSLRMLSSP